MAYGAANVASLRRLKNIVHSVIAAKAVYGDTMRRLQRTAGEGPIDRAASKLAARSFAKLHDAGGAIDMASVDASLRGNALRSVHGGSVRGGSVRNGRLAHREGSLQRGASLKKAASALALSDLVRHSMASRDSSTHGSVVIGEGSRRGSMVGESSRHGEGSRRGSWRGKLQESRMLADSSTLGMEAPLETLQERARRASEDGMVGEERERGVRGGRVFEGAVEGRR